MKLFTEEMRQFLINNLEGIKNAELAEMINRKFGVNLAVDQIKSYKARHHLSSGLDGRFKKGCIPHNKGKKGIIYPGSEKGWFPKGNTPKNHRPVGSERINVEGYIEIKVAEPNKWEYKHVEIWESVNGKVPKSHVVIFLDGDRLNTDISNLKLIARKELLIMNRYGLFQDDAELTETAANLAKVIDAKHKARHRIKQEAK